MRAVVLEGHGGRDQLQVGDVPQPAPGDEVILVLEDQEHIRKVVLLLTHSARSFSKARSHLVHEFGTEPRHSA